MGMNPAIHGDGDRAIGIAFARLLARLSDQTTLGREVVRAALADLDDVPVCHPGPLHSGNGQPIAGEGWDRRACQAPAAAVMLTKERHGPRAYRLCQRGTG